MSIHACKEIIDEIERESNSDKFKELAKKLNDAMLADEREKVSHRLGCQCSPPSRSYLVCTLSHSKDASVPYLTGVGDLVEEDSKAQLQTFRRGLERKQ
jgi:hypothetical protein